MEGVLKAFSATITGIAGKKSAQNTQKEEDKSAKLLTEIREIKRQLETAYNRFENENDSDLIDACVYELESLTARYRHLLRCAKELNLVCPQAELATGLKGAKS